LLAVEGTEADASRFGHVTVWRADGGELSWLVLDGDIEMLRRRLGEIPMRGVQGIDFGYLQGHKPLREREVIYIMDGLERTAGMLPADEVQETRRELALRAKLEPVLLLLPRPRTGEHDGCAYQVVECRLGPEGDCPDIPPFALAVVNWSDLKGGKRFAVLGEVLVAGLFDSARPGDGAAPTTPIVARPLLTATDYTIAVDVDSMCAASVVLWPGSDGSVRIQPAPGTRNGCNRGFRPNLFFFPPATASCRTWGVVGGTSRMAEVHEERGPAAEPAEQPRERLRTARR